MKTMFLIISGTNMTTPSKTSKVQNKTILSYLIVYYWLKV
jgi:hypothetical protein